MSSKTVTRKYGERETAALQPALFALYRRLMDMRGTPEGWIYRQPLNQAISGAYERARAELGGGTTPNVTDALKAHMSRDRGLSVGDIWANIGQNTQSAQSRTAGSLGNYIANLTSSRPSQPSMPTFKNDKMAQILGLLGGAMQKAGAAGVGAASMSGPAPAQQYMANQVTGQQMRGMMTGLPMSTWHGF